uniref:Uncharacterized protein n=1 Tax=Meloidogyne enterolobii TaxID=390850 RepID=A0A6V7XCQ6_MELEN|nr:unnamed protein product [Meloidogyne enterolobii]
MNNVASFEENNRKKRKRIAFVLNKFLINCFKKIHCIQISPFFRSFKPMNANSQIFCHFSFLNCKDTSLFQ